MTANTNNDQNSEASPVPVTTIRRLVVESTEITEVTTNLDRDESTMPLSLSQEEFNNNDIDTTISSNVTDADYTILETEAWNDPPVAQVTLDDPDLVNENDFSWTGNGTSSLSVSELPVERHEAVAKRQPVDATRPVVSSNTSPPIATNNNGDDDDDDDDDDGVELPDIAVSTTSSNTTIEGEIQEEGILQYNSNNATDYTEETITELEMELQKEEEEAEQESALQDAELDAQGYVDGTPPLGTDDEIPSSMEMSPQPPPVEQGQDEGEVEGGDDDDDEVDGGDDDNDDDEVEGGDDDNDDDEVDGGDDDEVEGGDDDEVEGGGDDNDDDHVDPNEDATIDVEKDVEIWEEVEEWNEATEEHDKEWFEEYERTHSIDPATPTPTAASPKASSGKSNTTKTNNEIPKPQPGTINVHRPPDDNDTQETVDEQESNQSKGNPPSDGTIGDGNQGKGVNKLSPPPVPVNKLSPPPVPSPFASPTSSTSSKNNPTSPPGIIADKTSSNPHSLGFYAGVSLVPIILLFCLRKYVCRPKRPGDKRGEYRAVAARYGDMGYDNTFSDAMSDDEDDDFMDGHGDIEDDSWGKAGKRTLELPKLKKERNGGLSLAEMNG